ncbi:MAG: ABC transporter permease, partial [Tannerellaceae bacterium]
LRDKLMVAIAPDKRAEAITFLEDLFHEINGEGEFTYTFLDDEIAALYKEDARAVKIYVTFAIIAILISCLGLFGLSLYDIRQRYREIALRKINGASVKVITLLLLRKYLYTLLFAAIVASSLSYIAIEKYMESYTNKAPLYAWIFIVAILITAFISFCTLWWQIRKAVRINPADVLRGE